MLGKKCEGIMEPEKLRIIIEEAVRNATQFKWWAYLVMLIIAGLGGYLGTYVRKKAENRALHEDLEKITDKVEGVRSLYAERMENISHQNRLIIEQSSRRHQLRLAALEKRLNTHQHAYTLWRKLVEVAHRGDQVNPVVMECQDWWNQNCLYLEAAARQAFANACLIAGDHHLLLKSHAPAEDVKNSWAIIMLPGKLLVEGVELPSIAEDEPKRNNDAERGRWT